MIEVKDKREIMLGVILRAQVLLLRRTVRPRSNPWIQNPANQIIVVVLLPYSRQVRGKISANHVRSFANRMAGFATALFEYSFAPAALPWAWLGNFGPRISLFRDETRDPLISSFLQADFGLFLGGA